MIWFWTFIFYSLAGYGLEKLYELRYTVATHRWTLAKEVY